MLESQCLRTGTILENRYQILKELGRGGFGRTYLAADLNKFREECVLKEFAPQVSGADHILKAQELFQREAGVLYKLQHSQIPAFREMFAVKSAGGESLFIVQEYIEGTTYLDLLNQRLQQGSTFKEQEMLHFLHNTLPVLTYIHDRSVIHRDLSPDNIIHRSSDNLPVLIDFGGVKEVATAAASQYGKPVVATQIGKPGYSPDEQLLRGRVSPASDLYTLAATCLTLLTGKEPASLYDASQSKWAWEQYVKLSPQLTKILDRMLRYRPQDRYQSAAEVLAALPLVGGIISPATPPARPLSQPISQAKTFAIGNAKPLAPDPTAVKVERDPNEWKKPAWRVTKVVTGLFVTIWAGNAAIQWAISQSAAFQKSIDRQIGEVTKSIPNPWKTPSVEERQADLNRKLKAKNISVREFYRQVDREFYAQHPELKGRPLTKKPEDLKLRQEWQDLAVKLLPKADRSSR
jgi:serine/threonine protein kinase